MKILVPKQSLEGLTVSLAKYFGDDYEVETFDECLPLSDSLAFFPTSGRSVFVFCDGVSLSENDLAVLGKEIAERPEEIHVAVRYPEIAEGLRDFEIHADIMGMKSSVESLCEAINSFVEPKELSRIFIIGGRTSWSDGLCVALTSFGIEVTKIARTFNDVRLKVLFESRAFDLSVLTTLSEIEALENRIGIPAEEFTRYCSLFVIDADLLLQLRRRGINAQLLSF